MSVGTQIVNTMLLGLTYFFRHTVVVISLSFWKHDALDKVKVVSTNDIMFPSVGELKVR